MPTIYNLKPKFQQLLRPLIATLHQHGITANQVTLTAMLGSMAYGIWMFCFPTDVLPFLILPVFMFVRMALNAIDGMLAREYHQQSALGAILNEMGDVVSDTALYVPFAVLPGIHPGIVMGIIFLSILTEFMGVLGQVIGGGRRYDGPVGKSDRAFIFGTLGLLIGLRFPIQAYLNPGFLLLGALLCWTLFNRAVRALRSASEHASH